MRILLGDLIPESRDTGMRCITVLFLDRDPCRFLAHELRRREVGLTKAKVDTVRQSAFEELADQRGLKSTHPGRKFKRATG